MKLKNIVKSMMCALLLLVLLAGPVVSCADKTENRSSDTTVAVSTTVAETTAEDTLYDENGYEKDFVGDFEFNKDFTIFYWDDAPYVEFNTEGESGTNVSDANYRRNMRVEERCGVKLKYVTTAGSSPNRNQFVTKLKTLLESDESSVDLVGAYSMAAGIAAISGLYTDLYICQNFEWDKPWWPESLKELSTINGKLYFASGDISLNSITSMLAVFFNKSMLTDRNLEDPYVLFENKQWTLDKMWEMSKGVYQDVNNDGTLSVGDTFGMFVEKSRLDGFQMAAGVTFLKNNNNSLEISEDFLGEKEGSILGKLASIMADQTASYLLFADDDETGRTVFSEGQVLFLPDPIVSATHFNDTDIVYGMVPLPLITEAQDQYYTPMEFTITFFSIPYTEKDIDCASAVMEILASESYRSTSPALFDQDLKCRYSQDATASKMFDVMRANVIYDLGRIFSQNFDHPYNTIRDAVKNGTSWTSTIAGKKKLWNNQMKKLLEAFG